MPFDGRVLDGHVLVLAAESVTVSVTVLLPLLPSTTEASAIESDGSGDASSLVITTSADPSAIVSPTGADRFTLNDSSGSNTVSPRIVSEIVAVVAPAANVTVPDAAV